MTRWIVPSTCDDSDAACNSGYCVAVAFVDGQIHVRDSKLGDDSPVLTFTPGQWVDVIDQILAVGLPAGMSLDLPERTWTWAHDGVKVTFTDGERKAFFDAVVDGQFDVARLQAVR